jgi:cyclohexanone monooxygenase
MGEGSSIDVAVVGAGFAGLYMLYRLRQMGFSVRVLEAGSGVGGTWFWNRYPGARCDVESLEYSYQFSPELQQEWHWSERYAGQPEILRYANHVADRFDLRRDSAFNTRVAALTFDEAANRWHIITGDGARLSATHCVMATGCLSVPNKPKFKGMETFAGPTYHTGTWPHEDVDFTGLRVGMIGTGSSAVQSIPIIAQQAKHLTVFQRTPSYAIPARNAPLDSQVERAVKADYPGFRALAKTRRNGLHCATNDIYAVAISEEERRREYQARWDKGGLCYTGSFMDLLLDKQANDTAAEFIRERIRSVVHDPAVAELLCPQTVVGCKRLCIDTGYYETFNRDNVTLIDVRDAPIDEITRDGLTTGGKAYQFDALIYATGFDAMTGALLGVDIRGVGGARLRDAWAEGPRTYLGLSVAGFPNLFAITGPGSPSVLTNMVPSIEQHVDWIADCLRYLRDHGLAVIEADAAAEREWTSLVDVIAGATLMPRANSWYMGRNVDGKPQGFMPFAGGAPGYRQIAASVAADGYRGFTLAAAPDGAGGP